MALCIAMNLFIFITRPGLPAGTRERNSRKIRTFQRLRQTAGRAGPTTRAGRPRRQSATLVGAPPVGATTIAQPARAPRSGPRRRRVGGRGLHALEPLGQEPDLMRIRDAPTVEQRADQKFAASTSPRSRDEDPDLLDPVRDVGPVRMPSQGLGEPDATLWSCKRCRATNTPCANHGQRRSGSSRKRP